MSKPPRGFSISGGNFSSSDSSGVYISANNDPTTYEVSDYICGKCGEPLVCAVHGAARTLLGSIQGMVIEGGHIVNPGTAYHSRCMFP